MKSPLYLRGNRKRILTIFLKDVESQFGSTPFDEIQYTIKPSRLKNEATASQIKIGSTVKSFLRANRKRYSTRKSNLGRRYVIEVSREELEKWKKDLSL